MLLPVMLTIQPQKKPVFTSFSSRDPLASKSKLLYARCKRFYGSLPDGAADRQRQGSCPVRAGMRPASLSFPKFPSKACPSCVWSDMCE